MRTFLVFGESGSQRGLVGGVVARVKRLTLLVVLLTVAGLPFRGTGQSIAAAPGGSAVKGTDVQLGKDQLGALAVSGVGTAGIATGPSPDVANLVTSSSSSPSLTIEAPLPFTHIGVVYTGTIAADTSAVWEARASSDKQTWTRWNTIVQDDDLPFSHNGYLATSLVGLREDKDSTAFRYLELRVRLMSPRASVARSALNAARIAFIDPTSDASPAPSDQPDLAPSVQQSSAPARSLTPTTLAKPGVVSRVSWGCPDGESSPNWPPQYKTVTHAIVHHTVTTNYASDWAGEVRAIWYYHAITLGWGDIGYNYLIDPNGSIYEGRAGGDDVIGGHALQYNAGSVGVAYLGTYTSASPTGAARSSMTALLAWKADQRAIDPTQMSVYLVDQYLPTIMGHRDTGISTSCPGDGAYATIPTLRNAIWQQVAAQPVSLQIVSASFDPVTLPPGNLLRVTATVRNNGSATAQTQGPAPGYVYNEGDVYSNVEAEKFDRYRLGVDYDGRTQAQDHPYRWGFGRDLAPGDSVTVVGYIRLYTVKKANYWLGLVQEGIRWTLDGVAKTSIQVGSTSTTTDTVPPTVSVSLPTSTSKSWLVITWSASDVGSGLAGNYAVDFSTDATNWQTWITSTPVTSALFPVGTPGQAYYFRVRTWDNAGNQGWGIGGPVQLGYDRSGLTQIWLPQAFNKAQR